MLLAVKELDQFCLIHVIRWPPAAYVVQVLLCVPQDSFLLAIVSDKPEENHCPDIWWAAVKVSSRPITKILQNQAIRKYEDCDKTFHMSPRHQVL